MNNFKYINFIIVLLLFSACSLSKGLKENQYLVYDVDVRGVDKADAEAIRNLISQKPNTRVPIVNFAPGVFLHDIGSITYDSSKIAERKAALEAEREILEQRLIDNPGQRKERRRYIKTNSLISSLERNLEYGNWFMRTGNQRVVYDSLKKIESEKQIGFYLVNNGFFDAQVAAATTTSGKKAYITYNIVENDPYLIDTAYTRSDDPNIYQILNIRQGSSNILPNTRYIQANLSRERQWVEDILRENGYYTFSKSYIEYNVYKDTVDKKVTVEQLIRKPIYADQHRVYTIDSVSFTISSPNEVILDRELSSRFDEKTFVFYRGNYSEKIINSRIFINQGDHYNRRDILETQRQLANLDIFRFVNIGFDTLGNTIQAHITTSPSQKYQVINQLGASVTEQLPGPFFSHSLRNRNFFGGLEIFELNFRAGLEGVASATAEGGVYRSRELNTSVSILFPQFIFPFNTWALNQFGRYNPRTRALLGYNYVNRPEYTREALNTILSYNWATRDLRQQFTLNFLDANFIRSSLNPSFQERLEELQNQGNNLINSFLSSYVSSISGQAIINFNEYGLFRKRNASLLRLFVESGGTSYNFVRPAFFEERTLAYFQFLKFQADWRRYIPLGNVSTFAYRTNLGLAQPYGISDGVLPYEKYFFAGGSTSNRAWQPRRLGPGSFTPITREDGTFDYRFEQPGEIVFETMFEYRRKLFSYFDGAFFVDAGNIWTFLPDPTREGANFRFDRFYKEIAVGTGLGLRMDFDFLVLRLDMGVKAYDPAREEGERFVLDRLNFRRPLGDPGQAVFNIGIGYPF
ncbi:translocation and assembly module lipoprotein TamL [Anditalea andensis]|uniref:Membrane protein n=1 Tax=Anditalea andensis TaxID=1048983 RepID=A0A074KUG8_9BACT|nr:BamA/TamA family outer membrane protein [Anditalea andensis]KEO72554.1 membrane protein [Anditalea andensis]